MKTDVILLAGYARSGKDSVADYTIQSAILSAKQAASSGKTLYPHKDKFARPLYDMLSVMYENRYDFNYIDSHKNEIMPHTNCTWRTALQKLGTEFGRDVLGSDIWARLAVDRVVNEGSASGYLLKLDGSYVVNPSKFFIFSDCRFKNELQVFKEDNCFNTHLIYVERKESQPQTHHRSEQQILELKANADYIIVNNQSLKDLYIKIDTVLSNIFDKAE